MVTPPGRNATTTKYFYKNDDRTVSHVVLWQYKNYQEAHRSQTAQRSMSLDILLSHSWSFEITPMRQRV